MDKQRQMTVAVVDDDEAVRDSLRFLLETAGFDVDIFASACQFLKSGYAARATCVLVDQHMPRTTGLDLLRQLRGLGNMVPVALMTGSPSIELTRLALELGVSDVMEKPLADEALFDFIARASL